MWEQQRLVRAAEKSFCSDGYKQVRVLAFGEDLCKTLIKRIGVVSMVVGFADLKLLDYSEHTG